MDTEATLLAALHADPADEAAWLALADWLEEAGQPDRAELARRSLALRTPARAAERPEHQRRVQELLRQGVPPCVPEVVNSLGMRLVLIPPGSFQMGSPEDEQDRMEDAEDLHEVQISRAFYLGVFPVTQSEYEHVTGTNPSGFRKGRQGARQLGLKDTRAFPVERVSWEQAAAFCTALSELPAEKKARRTYRLPSEAEWEYACRAGTTTPFHFGDRLDGKSPLANFRGEWPYADGPTAPFLKRTCPVGSYPPNAWALYDMHGNVDEWVADWHREEYYRESPPRDPPGPDEGNERVIRGGSWNGHGEDCRAAVRIGHVPTHGDATIGFRVVMTRRARRAPRPRPA